MPDFEPQTIDATEVSYRDDEFEPSVSPPPLTRAQVVTEARIVMAQAQGIAGLVEQAAMNPRMRREFLNSWRRWFGALIGYTSWLERNHFDWEEALKTVRQREAALGMWRAGLQMELQQGVPPTVGATAPPVEVKKPGVLANVPWWVLIPAGVGVAVGGYYGMRYIFRQWFAPAEESVATVKRITEYIPMGKGEAAAQAAPAAAAQPQS
jgi:hypothetical protein